MISCQQLAGRIIRVDHVEEYKVPKVTDDMSSEQLKLFMEGCGPESVPLSSEEQQDDIHVKDGK